MSSKPDTTYPNFPLSAAPPPLFLLMLLLLRLIVADTKGNLFLCCLPLLVSFDSWLFARFIFAAFYLFLLLKFDACITFRCHCEFYSFGFNVICSSFLFGENKKKHEQTAFANRLCWNGAASHLHLVRWPPAASHQARVERLAVEHAFDWHPGACTIITSHFQ